MPARTQCLCFGSRADHNKIVNVTVFGDESYPISMYRYFERQRDAYVPFSTVRNLLELWVADGSNHWSIFTPDWPIPSQWRVFVRHFQCLILCVFKTGYTTMVTYCGAACVVRFWIFAVITSALIFVCKWYHRWSFTCFTLLPCRAGTSVSMGWRAYNRMTSASWRLSRNCTWTRTCWRKIRFPTIRSPACSTCNCCESSGGATQQAETTE